MSIRGFFKGAGKTYLPIGWLGQEVTNLKQDNKSLITPLKDLMTSETPTRTESFEEAIARLGLKPEDIASTMQRYSSYALFFFLAAVALFAYAFYLLFAHASLSGLLLAFAATAFCLAQAFRFDFWAYQMKQRRLGISFNEWKQHILGKGAPT